MDMLSTMDPLAFLMAMAQIAAAIAVLNGIIVPIGQGNIGVAAIESIARQPEATGTIRSTMFIALATSETSGIYGLLIAIILLFANPMVSMYMNHIS